MIIILGTTSFEKLPDFGFDRFVKKEKLRLIIPKMIIEETKNFFI
jgi:hypothetical protein